MIEYGIFLFAALTLKNFSSITGVCTRWGHGVDIDFLLVLITMICPVSFVFSPRSIMSGGLLYIINAKDKKKCIFILCVYKKLQCVSTTDITNSKLPVFQMLTNHCLSLMSCEAMELAQSRNSPE
jgi:hypothetical protein